jgi:hypothetical protein
LAGRTDIGKLRQEGGNAVMELGSGVYRFEVQ